MRINCLIVYPAFAGSGMLAYIALVTGSSVTIAVSRWIVLSTLGSPVKLVFSSIALTNPDIIHLSNWFLFRSDYDQSQGIPHQMQDARRWKNHFRLTIAL